MSFFEHEIEALKEKFPDKPATLTEDLDEDELAAIANLGVLKYKPHLYLGKILILFFACYSVFFRLNNSIFPWWKKKQREKLISSVLLDDLYG